MSVVEGVAAVRLEEIEERWFEDTVVVLRTSQGL